MPDSVVSDLICVKTHRLPSGTLTPCFSCFSALWLLFAQIPAWCHSSWVCLKPEENLHGADSTGKIWKWTDERSVCWTSNPPAWNDLHAGCPHTGFWALLSALRAIVVELRSAPCSPEAGRARVQVACSSLGDLPKLADYLSLSETLRSREEVWCVATWTCVPIQIPAWPLPLWALLPFSQGPNHLPAGSSKITGHLGRVGRCWAWKWIVSSQFPASFVLNWASINPFDFCTDWYNESTYLWVG